MKMKNNNYPKYFKSKGNDIYMQAMMVCGGFGMGIQNVVSKNQQFQKERMVDLYEISSILA